MPRDDGKESTNFPLAGTRAARMLAKGLNELGEREQISQRQLAKRLGYKQSVMLSHWSSGRTPIPIERVLELADALGLDERSFLLAVLEQRHPSVDWDILEDQHNAAYHFVQEIQNIARCAVEDMEPGQLRVMREAAADRSAPRRWLSVHEVSAIELLRELRPNLPERGLEPVDRHRLTKSLAD